ncbi:PREDICTED: pathogenesis-related protein 1A-like [Nelumbo nucifera]|uniref:Pathogenesis-related protein 1A-like n=1 Tax=Nelumbo nucifera TaxID=4432 RepID=A0A1U8AKU8_NELNU|nr:PREDICTED: pathogenesis-related protein 1A-like [Nelumbo nucifera]
MAFCRLGIFLFFLIMGIGLVHVSRAQDSHQNYLDAHNAARAEVGVDALTWDDTVAAYAQSYANKRADDCTRVHSGEPYGENLAGSTGSLSATDAVNLWVGEKQYYDHNSNSCIGEQECRHYTQVVWRKSFRVGCAKVQCNNGGTFVICNYDPAGNVVGELPY